MRPRSRTRVRTPTEAASIDDRSTSTAAEPAMIQDVLVEGLQDLLHAEGQLVKALPKMAKAANSDLLRLAFEKHLDETRGQVDRLKEAFELLGVAAKPKPCKGMAGLLEEGNEVIEEGDGQGRPRRGPRRDRVGAEGGALRDLRLRHLARARRADRTA